MIKLVLYFMCCKARSATFATGCNLLGPCFCEMSHTSKPVGSPTKIPPFQYKTKHICKKLNNFTVLTKPVKNPEFRFRTPPKYSAFFLIEDQFFQKNLWNAEKYHLLGRSNKVSSIRITRNSPDAV